MNKLMYIVQLPRNVTISDFPSLSKPWLEKIVSNKVREWAKRMRLALAMRRRVRFINDIRIDLVIPDKIGGDLPTHWWNAEDDKDLMIGAVIHGVGKWEDIRMDESLGFMRKCLIEDVKEKKS